MLSAIAISLSVAILSIQSANAIYCKNEQGYNVDFFVAYKLPKLEGTPYSTGTNYVYMSGNRITGSKRGASKGWNLSSKLVTDSDSIFGKTLATMYTKSQSRYTYFMYNDDPPEEESGSSYRAHAKGVLVMDSRSGYWLSHSIPNFPLAFSDKEYKYPDSGHNNGQTAICISFKTRKDGEDIVRHLITMQPSVYASQVTDSVAKYVPSAKDLQDKKTPTDVVLINEIKSAQGVRFTTFARSRKASGDLWSETIAPQLRTPMYVETWRRGAGGPLDSNCSAPYDVNNVHNVNIVLEDGTKLGEYKYVEDHSKWGISDSNDFPYICIGDINRMASQAKRGGGAVCVKDQNIRSAFFDSIAEIEPCQ